MIEELVPATVATVVARADLGTELFGEELRSLVDGPLRAVAGRFTVADGIVATAVVVAR